MKNKYTFLDAAEEVLKKLNYPENSRNLWKEIEKLGKDKIVDFPKIKRKAQLFIL